MALQDGMRNACRVSTQCCSSTSPGIYYKRPRNFCSCAVARPPTWERWSATPLVEGRGMHPPPLLPLPRCPSASHVPAAQQLGCVPCCLLPHQNGYLHPEGERQQQCRIMMGGKAPGKRHARSRGRAVDQQS